MLYSWLTKKNWDGVFSINNHTYSPCTVSNQTFQCILVLQDRRNHVPVTVFGVLQLHLVNEWTRLGVPTQRRQANRAHGWVTTVRTDQITFRKRSVSDYVPRYNSSAFNRQRVNEHGIFRLWTDYILYCTYVYTTQQVCTERHSEIVVRHLDVFSYKRIVFGVFLSRNARSNEQAQQNLFKRIPKAIFTQTYIAARLFINFETSL